MEENKNDNGELLRHGVKFNTLAQSPSETATSLQVICFFEYKKNQHYEGGTYAVNEHFHGEIAKLRTSGIFRGLALERLLITTSAGQIPAKSLLLLGLGDPEALDLGRIELMGYTAAMEAIKLKVPDFSFAPSLKDAGLELSFEKTDVSRTLAMGMINALDTAVELVRKGLFTPSPLNEINLLAGKARAENAHKGLRIAFGLDEGKL